MPKKSNLSLTKQKVEEILNVKLDSEKWKDPVYKKKYLTQAGNKLGNFTKSFRSNKSKNR